MPDRHYSDITISQLSQERLAAELTAWSEQSLDKASKDPEFWLALMRVRPELRTLLALILSSQDARKAVEAAIIVS